MNDDDSENDSIFRQWNPPDVLAGWSPGAKEIHLPEEVFRPLTAQQHEKAVANQLDVLKKKSPDRPEFLDFPLYYGCQETRRRKDWYRSSQQEKSVRTSLRNGVELVLATSDYTVYRANNIWRLLWLYFRYKITRAWKNIRTPKAMRMPSYTRVRCQPKKPKSERISYSRQTSSSGQRNMPKKTTRL